MNNNIRLPTHSRQMLRDKDCIIAFISTVRERLCLSVPEAMRMLSEGVIEVPGDMPRALARDFLAVIRTMLPAATFLEAVPGDMAKEVKEGINVKKARGLALDVLGKILVIEGPTGDLRDGERVAVLRGNLVEVYDKLMSIVNELSE